MRSSIQKKLVVVVTGTVLGALVLAGGGLLAYHWLRGKRALGEQVSVLASTIAENSKAALSFDDPDAAREMLATLAEHPSVESACIVTEKGEIFAQFSRGTSVDEGSVLVELPIELERRNLGTVRIRASLERIRDEVLDYARLTAVMLFLAGIVALMLSSLVWRRVLKPLRSLVDAAGYAGKDGDYSVRVEKSSDDELGDLVDAINQMLGCIEERDTQLRAAKKIAEDACRAKALFIAHTSHEIRTPLNGVLGTVELLADTQLDEDQRSLVSTGISCGRSLLGVINEILDFSKIEAKGLVLERVELDLIELIESTARMQRLTAAQKGVRLEVDVDGRVPRHVLGDSGRLGQILTNLVSNALKFTVHGGVFVGARVVSEDERRVEVELSVRDTGIGIPQDRLDRLFKSFSQVDASTTRRYGGTGLGLAISKGLAEAMGGRIGCESRDGEGSRFFVVISFERSTSPSIVLPVAARPEPRVSSGDRRGTRVLIVEDNLVNQKIATRMLDRAGFVSAIAANGKEALAIAECFAFDAVLMDCQMPEMDGFEATEALRARGMNMPIIALTANATGEDRHRCLNAGMNDFLAKPFTARALVESIEKNLPNRTALAPAEESR